MIEPSDEVYQLAAEWIGRALLGQQIRYHATDEQQQVRVLQERGPVPAPATPKSHAPMHCPGCAGFHVQAPCFTGCGGDHAR